MRLARSLTLVVLTLALNLASAQASTLTLNYDFSASGLGPGSLIDPVTGSFSLTFDNAVGDLTEVTSGISITNLNFAFDLIPAFNYDAALDMLTIGGTGDGVGVTVPTAGTNDFVLTVLNASSVPPDFGSFQYEQFFINGGATNDGTLNGTTTENSGGGSTGAGATGGGSTGADATGADVPEPTALTLLGLGLAGLGARRWRQRKA